MAWAMTFDGDPVPGRRTRGQSQRGRRDNPGDAVRPDKRRSYFDPILAMTATGDPGAGDEGERHGRRHGPPHGDGSGRGGGPGAGGFGPGGFGGPGGPGGFGPGGPGPFGGRGGRGDRPWRRGRHGRRGARGDVRSAILLLLTEEPMHGYQLIQQMAERSGGVWRPSPGSVYPTLSQLADEGLIEITSDEGRNVAKLTDAGNAYIEEHRDELGTPWDEVAGSVKEEAIDVKGEIGALMGAVHQVLRVGSAEQVGRATEILADTRKSLYRILADDENGQSSDTRPE